MSPAETRKKTIIEKYGSLEAYNLVRYGSPEERKKRMSEIGKLGGKNSTARGFRDIKGLASRAGKVKKK